MVNRDKAIGTIYTTDDYSKFEKLQGNRDVKGTRKVIKSIEAVGYVLSPILVNEKFQVIDGQTRLEALKTLNLPVPYMIQEGIGLKECRYLNIGQSNWTTRQFIESYAADGNNSYIRLLSLIKDFEKMLSFESVMLISLPHLLNGRGGTDYKPVREGKITLTDLDRENTRKKLQSVIALGYADFKKRYDMSSRSYWSAVSYAYCHERVNPSELIAKMKEDPNAIIPCVGLIDQLRYFDEAYNRRKRAHNRVFMASDFQRGEYR